jgi:hypothetical protein
VHDLLDTEYSAGNWSHTDGFTIRDYDGTQAIVRNSRIHAENDHCTGAAFLQATWADSYYDHISFSGNLFAGNGYLFMIERSNGAYGTDIHAVNNRFDVLGYGVGYVEHGPGWAEWLENYLSEPTEPDYQGDATAEPLTGASAALTAPDALTIEATASSAATLSWADHSDGELGFRIARALDGVTFNAVAITSVDATSYVDEGLLPSTTYWYEVAAVDNEGMSTATAPASVTTLAP